MNSVLKDERIRIALILGALLLIAIPAGAWIGYRAGGETGLLWFGDLSSVLTALLATGLIVRCAVACRRRERVVWALIAVSYFLWAVAECVWGYAELVLEIEAPYPSVADAVWIVAYLPLVAALWLQSRANPVRLLAHQVAGLLGIFLSTFGTLFLFVILPILLAPSGGRLLEKTLNVLYPVMDLIVLAFLLLAFLAQRSEANTFGWSLFLAGIVWMAVVDLLFSYATWNGLYHSAATLDWVIYLIEVGYPISYLSVAIGAQVERRLKRAA